MLLNCGTQYVVNLENSAVATGLEKVSFQGRAMPKNAQTSA